MIRGLVLGKFLPPHQGHLHLIEQARKNCDLLTVVVGTLQREPIDGNLRFFWMQQLCDGCRVVHLTDENPQYPNEHPDFWSIWRLSLKKMHPEPVDILFSSEDYGDRLARELDAKHHSIDPDRKTVPISGTEIRRRPISHYSFIPLPVRPYFNKKIVITGAESAGKTTTARHLANRFHTQWAHEYAREYLDNMGRFVEKDDIPHIAQGQMALEDRVQQMANRIYFCDTDLMATRIYSEHYFEECPSFIPDELSRRLGDFYIFMDTDIPWVSDPQRDAGHLRTEFRQRFIDELKRYDVEYVVIGGSFTERLNESVNTVNGFLQRF